MRTENILCRKNGREKYFSQEQLDLLGTQDGKHDGWEKDENVVVKSTGIVKTVQTVEKDFVFPDDLKNHEEDGNAELSVTNGKKFPKTPKKDKSNPSSEETKPQEEAETLDAPKED